MAALRQMGVSHILNVAAMKCPCFFPSAFQYKALPITDTPSQNIMQYFSETTGFIREAKARGGCVYVHCIEGKSRSASCVLAYLMDTEGMSLTFAHSQIKRVRPIANPNEGFMIQLQHYESLCNKPPQQPDAAGVPQEEPTMAPDPRHQPFQSSAQQWRGQIPPGGGYDADGHPGYHQSQYSPQQQAAPQHAAPQQQRARQQAGPAGASPHDLHAAMQQQSLSRAQERAAAQRNMFAAFTADAPAAAPRRDLREEAQQPRAQYRDEVQAPPWRAAPHEYEVQAQERPYQDGLQARQQQGGEHRRFEDAALQRRRANVPDPRWDAGNMGRGGAGGGGGWDARAREEAEDDAMLPTMADLEALLAEEEEEDDMRARQQHVPPEVGKVTIAPNGKLRQLQKELIC